MYEKSSVSGTPSKNVPVNVPQQSVNEKDGDIVVLANCQENDGQLKNMIERFRAVMPRKWVTK